MAEVCRTPSRAVGDLEWFVDANGAAAVKTHLGVHRARWLAPIVRPQWPNPSRRITGTSYDCLWSNAGFAV